MERKPEENVVVLRRERRSAKREELSCEEIMRLARERGRKAGAVVVPLDDTQLLSMLDECSSRKG